MGGLVPRDNPVKWFESTRATSGWKYSTTLTYVEAYLAQLARREQEWPTQLGAYLRALRAHARVEKARVARGITAEEVGQLAPHRSRTDLLLYTAFTLGQRPSDVALIATEDLKTVALAGDRFVVVTMRRSKTIKATGPFSLHILHGTQLANTLLRHQQRCLTKNRFFLFINGPTVRGLGGLAYPTAKSRNRTTQACAARLKQIDSELEIRSVRRGGLQRLAQIGFSIEEIREHFSKHTTCNMLNTYLEFGTHSIQQARAHRHAIQPREADSKWRTSRPYSRNGQLTHTHHRKLD